MLLPVLSGGLCAETNGHLPSTAAAPDKPPARLTAFQVRDGIFLRAEGVASPSALGRILRWADGETPRAIPAPEGKLEFVDSSAEYNRIYYYRLERKVWAAYLADLKRRVPARLATL